MALQRVTKESLDTQLTAKDLIDKDVYGRDQKKIGKVVDVVLPGSQSSPLAYAFSKNENNGSSSSSVSNSTGTDSASSGMGGSQTTGTGSSSRGGSSSGSGSGSSSGLASSSGNSSGSLGSSSYGSSSSDSSQPAVVIAHGGLMKKDLIRAPLSQLSYDSRQERLTLNVSDNEITTLTSNDSGR